MRQRFYVVVYLGVILASVVRRAERRDALDPVAALAGEQRTDAAIGGGVDLVRIAVFEKLRQHTDGLAAHAVADEVNLQGAVGVIQLRQHAGEGAPIAGVAVLCGVILAVVHRTADQIGVQLARSVPVACDRADGRSVDFVTGVVEDVAQAACAAPVVQAGDLSAAPAEQAVNQHDRVVVAVRREHCHGGVFRQLRAVNRLRFGGFGRHVGINCKAGDAQQHGHDEEQRKFSAPLLVFHG